MSKKYIMLIALLVVCAFVVAPAAAYNHHNWAKTPVSPGISSGFYCEYGPCINGGNCIYPDCPNYDQPKRPHHQYYRGGHCKR